MRDLDWIEIRPVPGSALNYSVGGNAFFSADGTAVAHYRGDGKLYIAAIDGRPLTALEERMGGFGGGWWAADNTIIRSSGRDLVRFSVADGTAAPLMPTIDGIVDTPVLLPDGHAVLFHASAAGNDRVDALDLGTREVKTVVEAASNPAYVDTGHLVFARADTLMAAPFDASALAVTGEAVPLVQRGSDAPRAAQQLRHLRRRDAGICARHRGRELRCGRMGGSWWERPRSRGTGARAEPKGPAPVAGWNRLLLVIGENEGALWSYDLRGRPPIPLAIQNDNRLPVWSPDGQRVAFVVGFQAGLPSVVTLRADGSEATPQPLRASGAFCRSDPELVGAW